MFGWHPRHHWRMYRRWRRPFFRPYHWRPMAPLFWGFSGCGCLVPLMVIMMLGGLMALCSMCSGPWYWWY